MKLGRRLSKILMALPGVSSPADSPSRAALRLLVAATPGLRPPPTISVVMPVCDPPPRMLDAAVCSLRSQSYPYWELCVADDASTDAAVRTVLKKHAAADRRIMFHVRESRGNVVAAFNTALAITTGDYIAPLDHDDTLAPHALFWVVDSIQRHPDAQVFYSDEDKIDASGRRFQPHHKCDFNHTLMLAQNVITHMSVYRRELVVTLGGFRAGFEGAQDHDLALRAMAVSAPAQIVHIPRILCHRRVVAERTAESGRKECAAAAASRRAVAEHLHLLDRQATVEPAPEAPLHARIRYALPTPAPLTSIVICTRDQGALLRTAIESIRTKTRYPNYEIIVLDNGSRDASTLEYLSTLVAQPGITLLRDDSPFNYSRLNNTAVSHSQGELVCLLNDDIEVLAPEWLEEMVSFAIQPDVGAVGARLWYPDGTLQHGGVILGVGGVAGHAHPRLPKGDAGYFGRAVLQQELAAVTGACLVVRRRVFDAVGGLDERLAVAFNDIDFCLRLRAAGYRNIWTPFAELIHHESASRGLEDSPEKRARFRGEIHFMQQRWGTVLDQDPCYSPHLSLVAGDYSLAAAPRKTSWRRAA